MTVVVDERSEIGACYQGIPQNELGIRTDIPDCCPGPGHDDADPDHVPRVIAVDEIGSREDLRGRGIRNELRMQADCHSARKLHR